MAAQERRSVQRIVVLAVTLGLLSGTIVLAKSTSANTALSTAFDGATGFGSSSDSGSTPPAGASQAPAPQELDMEANVNVLGTDMVTIWHRSATERNPWRQITVSRNSLDSHLQHGDSLTAPGASNVNQ